MVHDLLARAREQAEHAEPSTRAAALMRIGRVEFAFDSDAARRAFRLGLEAVNQITGQQRENLLQQARTLAAATDPDLLGEFPAKFPGMDPFGADMLVGTMTAHGHTQAAFAYAMRSEDSGFPYIGIVNLMMLMEKEEDRLTLFRRAIEAWRADRSDRSFDPFRARDHFNRLFHSQWRLLPEDEARDVVREIVHSELAQPDRPITATYEDGIVITSMREQKLFELIHVVRRLDGSLADSLIANHAQLAAAVRRFPDGMETMRQEAEERRKKAPKPANGESCGGSIGIGGNKDDIPYLKALLEASRDGDFGPAIEYALKEYREDSEPEGLNDVPKEFWPSTSRFRSILYSAGKRLGNDAQVYLDRVPDDELRLFAMIELAAALAGVPELRTGMQMRRQRRRASYEGLAEGTIIGSTRNAPLAGEPMRSPDGSEIRCPKCEWKPRAEVRWVCKCGHVWNTFWTNGLCPACQYQWTVTGCHRCHETSPHSEWYVRI